MTNGTPKTLSQIARLANASGRKRYDAEWIAGMVASIGGECKIDEEMGPAGSAYSLIATAKVGKRVRMMRMGSNSRMDDAWVVFSL